VKKNLVLQHMPNTILCTIDLSSSSKQSVKWAVAMAKQLDIHLTILYTYRLIHSKDGEILQRKKNIEEEAHKQFKALEKEFLTEQNISYDFRIEIGFVSDRIEDHAKKNKLNFLVMDKTMSTNSNENFEELVENIQVPLLLVP
jgi:hypothetical protein